MQIKTTTRNIAQLASLSALVCLAGCATPSAGPNAGASANAPPAPTTTQTATATPPPAPAAKPTLSEEAAVIAANKVDIVFIEGGTALTPVAVKQLDLAARLYRDANPVVMFTTGHTDKSGDEYANLLLSAKRAETVKRALVERGIPEQRLLIQALGESDLANTSDPLAAANRRVTITWRLL